MEEVENLNEPQQENTDESTTNETEVTSTSPDAEKVEDSNTSSGETEVRSDENTESVEAVVNESSTEDVEEEESGEDEEDHHEDDHHEEEEDYTELSKAELVEKIKLYAKSDNPIKADRESKKLKECFDLIYKAEKKEAFDKYIENGGEKEGFEYIHDELTERFHANLRLIRDHKVEFIKKQESQKEVNYQKKKEVLEKLRAFVDSEETNISFNQFKQIQEEWKAVGAVSPVHAKTLWANYNALVDRFYDNRSIYFELKELDRRKNLESKIELCERAEKLKDVEQLKDAIIELNELHNEFKHIGPVPADDQEQLWDRFKAASDTIYARRKEFLETLKEDHDKNMVLKKELGDKVQQFVQFNSDRIKEWNKKTKEILELQKQWEAVGGVPRAKAKEINKTFWSGFKTFFNNKGAFFKKLDAQRDENLLLKQKLVEQANELQNSTDWEKTAQTLKNLQNQWKDIGPVPEKVREKIYQEFKAACDAFFNNKRVNLSESEKEYHENLKKKEEICELLEKEPKSERKIDRLRELESAFNALGFVPKNAIKKIKKRFDEAVNNYIDGLDKISEEDREKLKIENEVKRIKSEPHSGEKLYRKEQTMRKQINQLENDIAVWKNNLEFFADSKTADKLRDEFSGKIDAATDELRHLKKELRMLRKEI